MGPWCDQIMGLISKQVGAGTYPAERRIDGPAPLPSLVRPTVTWAGLATLQLRTGTFCSL